MLIEAKTIEGISIKRIVEDEFDYSITWFADNTAALLLNSTGYGYKERHVVHINSIKIFK
jgi:hypothetical protein